MRILEVRALSDIDLGKEVDETYKELMNVRFRLATRQLARTTSARESRSKLARLLTVQRERNIARGKA